MSNGDIETMFVFVGAYPDENLAQADFAAIKDAKAAGWIGKYQAAVFTKKENDKIKILNTDSTTRSSGAKWGAAVGAVASLLFPAGLLAGLAVGAATGAVAGNIGKGWYAGDIKDLGDALETGEAGVIVVAQATPEVGVDRLLKNATEAEKKQIDANMAEIEQALDSEA